jgi:hypothetical protein
VPQTCPQCQSQAGDDASACPSCGASLRAPAPAAPAAPVVTVPAAATAAPAGTAPSVSAVPAYKFDAARWSLADRIAGVATVVLFISLFLSWFSYNLGIGIYHWNGLSAHGYLYIVMILSILIVAYLVLRAGWDELPFEMKIPHVTTMMVATLVNLVLVFIGFIFKPGGFGVSGVGWSFGAFLGLIAAIVAAAPLAIPQLRAKTMG